MRTATAVEQPGEFAIGRDALAIIPRGGDQPGKTVRLRPFARAGPSAAAPRRRARRAHRRCALQHRGKQGPLDAIALDAPLLTALVTEGREKRRDVPLAAIPPRMVQAVIAIEDRRFYDHPGVDFIGTTRAVLTNMFGSQKYLSGGSTITQQLVRNTFLSSMWGIAQGARRRRRGASSPSG